MEEAAFFLSQKSKKQKMKLNITLVQLSQFGKVFKFDSRKVQTSLMKNRSSAPENNYTAIFSNNYTTPQICKN